MFIGRSVLNLDSKGRLGIHSKIKELLSTTYSGRLILTTHTSNYISGFPVEEWSLYEEKLKQLPRTKQTTDFIRLIYSRASDVSLDNQGRVLIPASLRESAGLTKEVVVVGIMNKIEIWDSKKFKEYDEETGASPDVPEDLCDIGYT